MLNKKPTDYNLSTQVNLPDVRKFPDHSSDLEYSD